MKSKILSENRIKKEIETISSEMEESEGTQSALSVMSFITGFISIIALLNESTLVFIILLIACIILLSIFSYRWNKIDDKRNARERMYSDLDEISKELNLEYIAKFNHALERDLLLQKMETKTLAKDFNNRFATEFYVDNIAKEILEYINIKFEGLKNDDDEIFPTNLICSVKLGNSITVDINRKKYLDICKHLKVAPKKELLSALKKYETKLRLKLDEEKALLNKQKTINTLKDSTILTQLSLIFNELDYLKTRYKKIIYKNFQFFYKYDNEHKDYPYVMESSPSYFMFKKLLNNKRDEYPLYNLVFKIGINNYEILFSNFDSYVFDKRSNLYILQNNVLKMQAVMDEFIENNSKDNIKFTNIEDMEWVRDLVGVLSSLMIKIKEDKKEKYLEEEKNRIKNIEDSFKGETKH